ncbi:MAG: hypothetical protein DRI90_23940, partial [Deltaproteobacteria bacterium]
MVIAPAVASVEQAPGGCTEVALVEPTRIHSPQRSAAERGRIDRLIVAADKTVKDSAFRDVEALVELARLQLWRNEREDRIRTDPEQAHLNGQRAVAVDPHHPAGRLMLALTTTLSVVEASKKRGPRDRAVALGFVDLAGRTVLQGAPKGIAAAAHTLLGYAWLDRGQPQL